MLPKSNKITYLPVIHGKIECALAVLDILRKGSFDCIAVEIPAPLESVFFQAVKRLPALSAIEYTADNMHAFLPVEPTDASVCAARYGIQNNIPVSCIDICIDYPEINDFLPDAGAILYTGYESFVQTCMKHQFNSCKEDTVRESVMAHRLYTLSKKYFSIACVCGMKHAASLAELTDSPALMFHHAPAVSHTLYNIHPHSVRQIASETPFFMTLFELYQAGTDKMPDFSVEPLFTTLKSPFSEKKPQREQKKQHTFPALSDSEKVMATTIKALLGIREYRRFLSTLKKEQKKQLKKQKELKANLIVQFKKKKLSKKERLCRYYEKFTADFSSFERARLHLYLLECTGAEYAENTGEEFKNWQKALIMKFSRNYAHIRGNLFPDLFQLIISARSCVDDNFAFELWELSTFYPFARESSDIPTLFIDDENPLFHLKKIHFNRTFPAKKLEDFAHRFDRRKQKNPDEWAEEFSDFDFCSYPPEDIIIENFSTFLKQKSKTILSEQQCKTLRFTTSVLDGIDMRETLRNWHMNKEIFVKQALQISGSVDAVTVIFSDDSHHYEYCMTWQGEHENESDMAYYSTAPEKNIVGPGICRCEYGGFLMTYPPQRMFDVWNDPVFSDVESPAERLLLASLYYSQERFVAYIAPKPPRSKMHSVAAYVNKKIVYIPLSQFSREFLKKIRVFHILSSKEIRENAKDFIW